MANMTVQQLLTALRFRFTESGMQTVWNQLNQVLQSETPAGITLGDTSIQTYDIADGTGATGAIQLEALVPISGTFSAAQTHSSPNGQKVPPSDPGGSVGPHPLRGPPAQGIAVGRPTAGYRILQ